MYLMEYCYELNTYDLLIRIHSFFQLNLPDYFRPFLRAEVSREKADITILVRIGSEADYPVKPCDIVQKYHWEGAEYIIRIESSADAGTVFLLIPKRFVSAFSENANWLLYLALERQIIRYNRIVLHASAVIWQEKAYLFTAPSGGGKSTQARVWEEHCHAEIINGDKVVLHETEKELLAYGGPIAGSSGIYVNKSAPVGAIFQLEKGERNEVRPLTKRDAFLLLYSEAVKSDWDPEFNKKLLKIIETIPNKTNLTHLTCLPNHTAADFVQEWLKTRGIQ